MGAKQEGFSVQNGRGSAPGPQEVFHPPLSLSQGVSLQGSQLRCPIGEAGQVEGTVVAWRAHTPLRGAAITPYHPTVIPYHPTVAQCCQVLLLYEGSEIWTFTRVSCFVSNQYVLSIYHIPGHVLALEDMAVI